ncbi:MAG TPA: zf-HC2 domain-containing protein [Thermoanaerobaculia bacterium]|nr:zf-HC2 domain-containing protein [Thermoanaerobaculia bacterium]
MRSPAPRPGAATTRACPPAEDLAAFLDLRLDGNERREVESHLAGCEDCRESYSEGLRFRQEEAAAEDRGAGAQRRLVIPRRTWALAAGVLLAAGVAGLWLLLRDPWTGRTRTLVASLPAGRELAKVLGPAWSDSVWSLTRGQTSSLMATPAASVWLGARVVDLDVALRADDVEAARRLTRELVEKLANRGTPEEQVVISYELLLEELETGSERTTLLEGAALAEVLVADGVEPTHYQVGRWLEAGRLASLVGDPSIYRRRGWKRMVELLSEATGIPLELADAIGSLPPRTAPEPAATRTAIERLLAAFANGEVSLETGGA